VFSIYQDLHVIFHNQPEFTVSEYLAISLVLTLTSADYDSWPKVNLFYGFFNHFRDSTFYWRLPSKFFNKTLSTVDVRHRFKKKTFQNKNTH